MYFLRFAPYPARNHLLGEMKARRERWFRSGRLEVRVGRVIPVESQQGEPGQVAAMLEEAVRRLMEQV